MGCASIASKLPPAGSGQEGMGTTMSRGKLTTVALEPLTAWIDRYRLVQEQQFRRLDAVVGAEGHPHEEKEKES